MTVSEVIIDRMRANLRAAGIAPSDADLEAIAAGPFLHAVALFEARSAGWGVDVEPDYLSRWPDPAEPGAAGRLDSPRPGDGDDAAWPPTGGRDEAARAAPGSGRGAAAPNASDPDGGPIPDTLAGVAAEVRAGRISPVELVEQSLRRIEERDPELNAFQQVLADRALAAARAAEREIAAGRYRGPLHGIPVAIKDLVALSGTANAAGSRVLAGNVTDHDAAAVERLERAGAVIVGRTRMSEFAYLPGSSNGHHGPTRNPADPTRDAGGSSSGSAVAVATGMAYAAIGSDTGGSIRIPAAFCGVVGLKPTFGRVSLHGAVPLAWSLDHLGPITRSVADAALLLEVLAGEDPRDPRTRPRSDFDARLALGGDVRGLRVGVPAGDRERLGNEDAWAAVERGVAALRDAGAVVVPVELPELEDLWILNNTILAVEAAAFHEPWLRARLADYGDLARHRLLAAFAHGPGALLRAQRRRREIRVLLERRLEGVELLALPAQPEGAPPLDTPGWTLNTGPFNALGWPALSVPAGATASGLPLGLQLVGKPWADALVLRAGRVVRDALG